MLKLLTSQTELQVKFSARNIRRGLRQIHIHARDKAVSNSSVHIASQQKLVQTGTSCDGVQIQGLKDRIKYKPFSY